MNINFNEIMKRINLKKDIKFRFKFINEKTNNRINTIVAGVLARYDKLYFLYSVLTIIRELIINSLKANAKRVFFEMNGLDISSDEDYEMGMNLFRETIIGDFELIHDFLKEYDMHISLTVKNSSEGLIFEVANNSVILPEEVTRINQRIAVAMENDNLVDIFEKMGDEKEGAGLGLVLILMCMRNMGLSNNSFSIKSVGNETVASLFIPCSVRPIEVSNKIKDLILQQIDGIPTFPQNIIELMEMCRNSDVSIKELAEKIEHDLSVSADVIKMANSAGFICSSRVAEIEPAIMTIGIKNLQSILIATSARKILESRYDKFEEIWEHCNKVAAYSRIISGIYNLKKDGENAFLAGLLHDLGKVILLAVDMKSLQMIADIIRDRQIVTTTVMEEISIGISHSEIGRVISEKWNLPQYLIETIGNHHTPSLIDEEYSAVTYLVNLANLLCGVEERKYYYSYIDISTLEYFKIEGLEALAALHENVKKIYSDLFPS